MHKVKVGDMIQWGFCIEKLIWLSDVAEYNGRRCVSYIVLRHYEDKSVELYGLDDMGMRFLNTLESRRIIVIPEEVVKAFQKYMSNPFFEIELERMKRKLS
jgi:hypothetical protein